MLNFLSKNSIVCSECKSKFPSTQSQSATKASYSVGACTDLSKCTLDYLKGSAMLWSNRSREARQNNNPCCSSCVLTLSPAPIDGLSSRHSLHCPNTRGPWAPSQMHCTRLLCLMDSSLAGLSTFQFWNSLAKIVQGCPQMLVPCGS